MTTLVLDAVVQPPREVGHHLLTHLARYGAQFRKSRGLSTYTFPLRYPNKKKSQGDRSGERGGPWHITSVGDELPRKQHP